MKQVILKPREAAMNASHIKAVLIWSHGDLFSVCESGL